MKQGWEIKKLGEVCETSSGGTPSKSHPEYYEGGNIPWLRSGEVSQGYIYDTELYITEEGLDNSSAKIFPIDTVVIAMYGATVGQVGILKKAMSTNQAICSIFPIRRLMSTFLVYYLKAKKSYFLSLAAGGAQPNISQQIIRETNIPIPPLVEQEKIVAELDCLSGVIEKKKQQLKELDALAESIFYTMFGDPITNEKGWEVSTIENVCSSIVRGPFGSALKKEYFVEQSNSTYKVYEQKHAIQKDSTIGTYYISADMFETLSRFEIKEGDIIMSCSGTIGEFYEIPAGSEKGVMNQALLKYTLNKNIDKIYFLYVMEWVKENFEKKGSGLQNIGSVKTIKSTNISLPNLHLQQEFATKIEAIEKQKELIKQSITETEELFNSRMDYYFG